MAINKNKIFYEEQLNSLVERQGYEPKVYNRYHGFVPTEAIYVGRGSKWGNPFVIGKDGTREEVIKRFCEEILPTLDLSELRGKPLVCFCKPRDCHADHLLIHANKEKLK